mgnify:CR=1 FL=1
MSKITFGRYVPSDSFADKCDPRGKLLLLIAYITAVFLAKNFYGLAVVAAMLIVFMAAAKASPLKVLAAVKGVLFLLLFTVIINLFFYKGGEPIFSWGIIRISKEGLYATLFLAARLVLLVCGSTLLTVTTSPVALTDGLESLLTPLKWIRFPVHELALIMSIALRFIPILSDETARIMSAQQARGADFETGGLVKRVKALIPVLIPLLISAFRRANWATRWTRAVIRAAKYARSIKNCGLRRAISPYSSRGRQWLRALFCCAFIFPGTFRRAGKARKNF